MVLFLPLIHKIHWWVPMNECFLCLLALLAELYNSCLVYGGAFCYFSPYHFILNLSPLRQLCRALVRFDVSDRFALQCMSVIYTTCHIICVLFVMDCYQFK